MRGRRPKPTHLRLITGNPGHRPLNNAEPRPTRGAPIQPPELSAEARQIWSDIAPDLLKTGLLSKADGLGLAMLCDAVADYRAARAELERVGGAFYETKDLNGNTLVRLHPAARVLRNADRQIKVWLVEFGKTPAARSKLFS